MVDKQTVQKVAELARLELKPEEVELFARQFTSILDSFEKLSAVPTEGVDPLVNPTEMTATLRQDEVIRMGEAEELLASAPEVQGHLYKVPPVV